VTSAPLELDAVTLLGLASPPVFARWARAALAADSLVYGSAHPFELASPDGFAARATFTRRGSYRLSLTVQEHAAADIVSYDVELRIADPSARELPVQGIFAPDLFENVGGPEFALRRDDPECQSRVFEHALDGIVRTGAEWVGMVPAAFLDSIDPLPVYVPQGNSLSLTDDGFYAELVGAARARGLRVIMAEQDAPSFTLPAADWQARDSRAQDPEWLTAWFEDWRAWILPRAARAEQNGVELYVPFNPTDFTFKPGTPYDALWRELIADVRQVYSGKVGVWLSLAADQRFTFVDAVDVVIVGVSAGFFPMSLGDHAEQPTLAEAEKLIGEQLDRSLPALAEAEQVYFFIAAESANRQTHSENQGERASFETDFQEQALYYEAFFAAIAERPFIDGVLVGVFDWFDQYARAPEHWYFDATNESSPRSKPAEQVLRLWFSAD
jgi:hypothetical protein